MEAQIGEIGKAAPLDFMARDTRYKWWVKDYQEYLLNLETDPLEMQNLANDPAHQDTLHKMREQMLTQLRSTQVNFAVGSKSKVERTREKAGAQGKK